MYKVLNAARTFQIKINHIFHIIYHASFIFSEKGYKYMFA